MKECLSYPGYSVTEEGQVFTHRRRFGKGKMHGGGVIIDNNYCKKLKLTEGHGGYLYASISTRRGQRSIPLHLLLLDAFVGPLPVGKETRHLDGNQKNNVLSNLCYRTRLENSTDTARHGSLKGSKHPNCKIDETLVKTIRNLHATGKRIFQIVKEIGCSRNIINGILSGRTWRHV